MNLGLGMKSILLFVLSVLFLFLISLFESSLTGFSATTERGVSFLLLVLPGLIGMVFGGMGVARKESKTWIAWIGILLNALFALFHLSVLAFAG